MRTKKLIVFVLTLVTLVMSMMILTSAADIDCKVYTADEMFGGNYISYGPRAQLIAAAADTPSHIHFSKASDETSYFRYNLYAKGVTEATYAPEFKIADYPIMVVSYRSNIPTKSTDLSLNIGLKLKTTGKYERCWRLTADLVDDEKWHKAIYDIRNFQNYSGGEATFSDVDANSGVFYVRLPIWDDVISKSAIKNTYFDIDYIAFFKTEADARAYGRGDEKFTEVTVTFNSETGSQIEKKKHIVGTTVALPEEPVVQGKIFKGWRNQAGEMINQPFKATVNAEYTAVHEYTEEGLAELKRQEEIAKSIAEATSKYDYIGYLIEDFAAATANKFGMQDVVIAENGLKAKRLVAANEAQKYDTSTYANFTLDASFLAKDFPIVVMGYRTNITTSKGIAISLGMAHNGQYTRFWGLRDTVKNTGKLENAIFDMNNITASQLGTGIVFKDVDATSNVTYVRVNPWGSQKGIEITPEDYFDIAYIAFFRTKEEASKFKYTEGCFEREVIADRIDSPFIKGYDNFLFKPENNMTRAEACTVVTRLLVDEASIKGKYTSSFSDVKSGDWYYDNIAFLENRGYLKSYSGEFKPNQNITRAEFVELVYAMGKVKEDPAVKLTFSDVSKEHPRYDVIMASASAKLVGGYPDGTFKPDGTIKRSEVVKVLCAALGRTPNMSLISSEVTYGGFADVARTHWAYPYIIESAYEHKLSLDNNGDEIWLEVIDNNTYMEQAPSNIEAELDKKLEERKNEIYNTKSEWTVAEGGTVWYISESMGNDGNDGKSPETPWQSLKKLEKAISTKTVKNGDVVLLKRGDTWHSKLDISAAKITLSAYGEGAKPNIYGSIEADSADMWIPTDKPNLYKLNYELGTNNDVACIFFNEGEAWAFRVLNENGKNQLCGDGGLVSNGIKQWVYNSEEFDDQNDLKYDLTFYHNWQERAVYLYCEGGNPADRFDSIEVSTDGHGITCGSDTVIDNICIKFTGRHGISGKSPNKNLTVRNCEIGFIGGAVQNPANGLGRLGNAVEIYGQADGYYVYNNYMHNCFDCGPTVQVGPTLTKGSKVIEQNIEFYDNVLWDADLEVWLTTTQENTEDMYAGLINCRIYNNMVTASGYGFSGYFHYKTDYVSFYGALATKAEIKDCYIENNYFWGARKNLLRAVPTSTSNGKGFHWRNNVIIKPYNSRIGQLGSDTKNASGGQTLYMYNEETIKKLLGDGAFGFNKFYYTNKVG